jgi:SAM-dependent methyltransferase
VTHETPQAAFWNRVARRYAAAPLRNPDAYETTLDRVRAHLPTGARVLELGCGTGSTALRLAPHAAAYTGTDDASEMIAIAREKLAQDPLPGLSFDVARPGDGSLPEGPFDAILAFNLLHLLPDRTGALREAAARLGPGGLLITKTPCLAGLWEIPLRPMLGVLRLLGKAPAGRIGFLRPAALEAEIVAAGFEILERGDHPVRPPSRLIVARAA